MISNIYFKTNWGCGAGGHDEIKWELQISRQKCDDTLNMIEESTGKMEFSRNLLHLLIDVCHTSALQGFFTSFIVVVIAIP